MSKSHNFTGYNIYHSGNIRKKIVEQNQKHHEKKIIIIPKNLVTKGYKIPKKIAHNILKERSRNQLKYLFMIDEKTEKIIEYKLKKKNKKFQKGDDLCIFQAKERLNPILILKIKKGKIFFSFNNN